jgi:DNA-binding MarR family transcriptional regulator
VIDLLRVRGVISVSEIADAIRLSPSAATLIVEELVQLGIVSRTEDPEDRRRRQVRLSIASLPDRALGTGAE